MFILNSFLEHKLVVVIIALVVIINVACILYLVIRERKKDREEIEDIVSSLSKAKPREVEIKAPELEEKKKEEPKSMAALEIEKVLEKMQKDLEATPQEVVNNFEREQEENSIISYKELVSSLKKETPVKEQIKETLIQDIEEEVESVNDEVDVIDIDDEISVKKIEPVLEEEEYKEAEEVEVKENKKIYKKKFKNTDFISPIFGKVETSKQEYPTVPQFSREERLEEILDEVPLKMTRSNKNNLEETLDVEPLQEEIRKNDEFLKTLKNFRNNL